MKKSLSVIALIIITSFALIVVYEAFRDEEPDGKEVIVTSFHSAILNENRELIVRLPRLYDSTKRYPIFYALDGGSLDRIIAEKLEVLSSVGNTPECIVIGIPNMTAESREKNLVPPFMHTDQDDVTSSMGEGDRFLKFIEDEVIPFIERQYSTSTRTFCGNSRGGLLVMYSFIHRPDLFDGRICFSTPFWRENDVLIDSVESFLSEHDSLSSFVFLSAGSNETENIKGGLRRMTSVLNSSFPDGVVRSSFTPHSVHSDNASISSSQAMNAWGKHFMQIEKHNTD